MYFCNMKSSQDIYFVNVTKTIAIFLVVFTHLSTPDNLFNFIGSFHLPVLLIISGYLLNINSDFKTFAKKKMQSLIIPYFVFSVITFLFWYFIDQRFSSDILPKETVWDYLIGIFSGIPSEKYLGFNIPMWYLLSLFCALMLLYGILHLKKYLSLLLIIVCGILGFLLQYFEVPALIFGINVSLFSIIFIYLGIILKNHNIIEKIDKKPIWIKLLFSLIFFAIAYFSSQLNGESSRVYYYLCRYNNYLLFFLSAITGSSAVILLSLCIPKTRILKFFGRNTIIIMSLHLICFTLIKGIQVYVLHIPLGTTSSLLWVNFIYVLCVFLLLTPVIFIMNKYFPILLGRKRKKAKGA